MPKMKTPKLPKMKTPKMPKIKTPKMPKIKTPKMPSVAGAVAAPLAFLKGKGIQIIVPILYLVMIGINIYIFTQIPFTRTLGVGFGSSTLMIGLFIMLYLTGRSNEFDPLIDFGAIFFFAIFTGQALLEMNRTLTKIEEEKKEEKKA